MLVLFLAGCGSGEFKIVAVSGTITMNGKPLKGAEVVFAPMEIKDVIDVGPISIGKTDSEGKFTLKTVKGVNGAVVTKHRVSVSFGEVDEAAIAAKVDEAIAKDRNMSEDQVMALERKARRALTSRKSIPESYNTKTKLRFEVEEATEAANFDLKGDGT